MSAYCHLLPVRVAVVFVLRDVADILASQSRIAGWREAEEPRELAKYFRSSGGASSAAVKYDIWDQFQKPSMVDDGKPFFDCVIPPTCRIIRAMCRPSSGATGCRSKQEAEVTIG